MPRSVVFNKASRSSVDSLQESRRSPYGPACRVGCDTRYKVRSTAFGQLPRWGCAVERTRTRSGSSPGAMISSKVRSTSRSTVTVISCGVTCTRHRSDAASGSAAMTRSASERALGASSRSSPLRHAISSMPEAPATAARRPPFARRVPATGPATTPRAPSPG